MTIFTGDLALLLQTGARINDALELLSDDSDIGWCGRSVAKITAAILAGESFRLMRWPTIQLYFHRCMSCSRGWARASGTLVTILRCSAERVRAEACAGASAMPCGIRLCLGRGKRRLLFLTFVLPQFGAVLRDFNAKLDPIVLGFLALSVSCGRIPRRSRDDCRTSSAAAGFAPSQGARR